MIMAAPGVRLCGGPPDFSALMMLSEVACAERKMKYKISEVVTHANIETNKKGKRSHSSLSSSSPPPPPPPPPGTDVVNQRREKDRVYPPAKWVLSRLRSSTIGTTTTLPSTSSLLASTSTSRLPRLVSDEPYKKMKRPTTTPSVPSTTTRTDHHQDPGLQQQRQLQQERANIPGDWREALARMSSNTTPLYVGVKELTTTDVSGSANRFLPTKNMQSLLWKTVSKEEDKKVRSEKGLQVTVLDGAGRSYELTLKLWGSQNWMVFNGKNYRKFIKDSGLRAHNRLHLWVFRRADLPQRSLCFALVRDARS
ncbi:hypothetical protein H6P81_000428 [Aristolochia fimbriata]|uniref:B3 domain-containing protein n=1 Tax=Aristolochia fimbriata TaxID=158543 RepID=A0AAV7F6L9_ARIFI|nr:hypothetical protein H6P81_000428 [Aristolochia fimbriata]